MKRQLYICDIDGTVADLVHRLHHIEGDNPNWNSFYEECDGDTPIMEVISIIRALLAVGNEIWFFTGRQDRGDVRQKTLDWLNLWVVGGHYTREELENRVVMRPDKDTRADDVVKLEMLNNMLTEDRQRLVAVFDDRQRVVDMWRENGVRCLQVAPGNF